MSVVGSRYQPNQHVTGLASVSVVLVWTEGSDEPQVIRTQPRMRLVIDPAGGVITKVEVAEWGEYQAGRGTG